PAAGVVLDFLSPTPLLIPSPSTRFHPLSPVPGGEGEGEGEGGPTKASVASAHRTSSPAPSPPRRRGGEGFRIRSLGENRIAYTSSPTARISSSALLLRTMPCFMR